MYFHMYWYLLVHDSYNHGKVFNKKQLEFKVCNLISGMLKRKFSEDEETSQGDNIVRLPTWRQVMQCCMHSSPDKTVAFTFITCVYTSHFDMLCYRFILNTGMFTSLRGYNLQCKCLLMDLWHIFVCMFIIQPLLLCNSILQKIKFVIHRTVCWQFFFG